MVSTERRREYAILNLCKEFLSLKDPEGKISVKDFSSEFSRLIGSRDITSISPGRFSSLMTLHYCGVLGKSISVDEALQANFRAEDYRKSFFCEVDGRFCLVEVENSTYRVTFIDTKDEEVKGFTTGAIGMIHSLNHIWDDKEIIEDIKTWLSQNT